MVEVCTLQMSCTRGLRALVRMSLCMGAIARERGLQPHQTLVIGGCGVSQSYGGSPDACPAENRTRSPVGNKHTLAGIEL